MLEVPAPSRGHAPSRHSVGSNRDDMSMSPAPAELLADDDAALSDDEYEKPEVLTNAEEALTDALQWQLHGSHAEAIKRAVLAMDDLWETVHDERAVPCMDAFWVAKCWRALGLATFRFAVNIAVTHGPEGLWYAYQALQCLMSAGAHRGYRDWSHADKAELFYDLACGESFVSHTAPAMAHVALRHLHLCRDALGQSVAGGDEEAPETCQNYGIRLHHDTDLNRLRDLMPYEFAQLTDDPLFRQPDEL